eukprot:CAMPEP_0172501542 /NCGR_PEP_ID=MMETSP1066-20121228/150738_1 /TAXON_ID=671091 /ORGANISM="Coscinodiscus wailesii, Strain CCMP2513" /LENGTH=465 /DNA_ID=CAMNT_0013276363 /DNA_START=115 /DNA_END=1509 /DNA_ORIENTATION=+
MNVTDMFQKTAPRDIFHAVPLAAKNVIKGGLFGALSLVMSPVGFYNHCGPLCLVPGAIIGVLGSFFFAAKGVFISLIQLLEGMKNTPGAFLNRRRGRVWVEGNEWKDYFLEEDLASLANFFDGAGAALPYYQLLGVPPSATTKEIKKAFRQKAKESHPDKSKDNGEHFRVLMEAYETLSEETSRLIYDEANGATEEGGFDFALFFNVLLDSERVKNYVGKFWIASLIETFTIPNNKENLFEKFGNRQRKREIEVGMYLKDKVDSFLKDGVDEFIRNSRLEAAEITNSAFGNKFLKIIGTALKLQAKEFLGSQSLLGLSSNGVWLKKKLNVGKNRFVIAGKTFKTVGALSKTVRKLQESRHDEDDNNQMQNLQLLEEAAPNFSELIWSMITNDVTVTIHQACSKLFSDATASMKQRLKRAEAIVILSDEFLRTAAIKVDNKVKRDEVKVFKNRAEVAFFKAANKEW